MDFLIALIEFVVGFFGEIVLGGIVEALTGLFSGPEPLA